LPYLNKQANGRVGTAAEDPRLLGVELAVEDTEVVGDAVAAEDLDGDDERVLEQVGVDHAVEDLDRGVVRARGEQGQMRVEVDLADRVRVVPQRTVRLAGELEVEPAQTFVVAAHDQVLAARMNRHARDPLAARHQLFHELLLEQVVHADVSLRLRKCF